MNQDEGLLDNIVAGLHKSHLTKLAEILDIEFSSSESKKILCSKIYKKDPQLLMEYYNIFEPIKTNKKVYVWRSKAKMPEINLKSLEVKLNKIASKRTKELRREYSVRKINEDVYISMRYEFPQTIMVWEGPISLKRVGRITAALFIKEGSVIFNASSLKRVKEFAEDLSQVLFGNSESLEMARGVSAARNGIEKEAINAYVEIKKERGKEITEEDIIDKIQEVLITDFDIEGTNEILFRGDNTERTFKILKDRYSFDPREHGEERSKIGRFIGILKDGAIVIKGPREVFRKSVSALRNYLGSKGDEE